MYIYNRVGSVAFAENAQAADLRMTTVYPVVELILRVSGIVTHGSTATLVEDTCMNLLRQIRLLCGGTRVQVGDGSVTGAAGKLLWYAHQLWHGSIAEYVAPGTTAAAHPFSFTISIPRRLPPALASNAGDTALVTCDVPGTRDYVLQLSWGNAADIASVGTPVLTATSCEVIAVEDPTLVPTLAKLRSVTKLESVHRLMSQTPGFGSGANTDDAQDLNANGEVFSFVLLGIDNGLRNDTSFKNVKVMRNNDETLFNTSWAASQYIIKRAAALQASTMPTGLSGILWDGRETGEGGVNAGNRLVTKGWKLHLDHAGFTGTYKLSVLHSYVEHETLA